MPLRALLVIATVVLTAGCAFPQEGTDTPDAVGGTYFLNGEDSVGTEYSGQLIITGTERPDVFDLQWIVTGSLQVGSGRFDGEILDGDWETVEGAGDARGTVTYELQDDGSLVGERLEAGRSEPNREEAFPVRE